MGCVGGAGGEASSSEGALVFLFLLIRMLVLLDWGPTLMTLSISMKVLSPNMITLGSKASTYEFVGERSSVFKSVMILLRQSPLEQHDSPQLSGSGSS